MKKALARFFIISLTANLILSGWFIYAMKYNKSSLIKIRTEFFVDFTEDYTAFYRNPAEMVKMGFKTDSEELINRYSHKILQDIEYINGIDKHNFPSCDIEKAKHISLLYSKNGGGGCLANNFLIDKIKKLPLGNGFGCCSDHAEVFLALSSVFGLNARTVASSIHVFNEFFDHELHKWIWIDSQFAILARNVRGEYLSLAEIREAYCNEEKVDYEFFGNEHHLFKDIGPYEYEYYDEKGDFAQIGIKMGNNVFEQDQFNSIFIFLPKALRQFIGLSIAIIPSDFIYLDKGSQTGTSKKYIYVALIILLGMGTILYPFYLTVCILLKHAKRSIKLSTPL